MIRRLRSGSCLAKSFEEHTRRRLNTPPQPTLRRGILSNPNCDRYSVPSRSKIVGNFSSNLDWIQPRNAQPNPADSCGVAKGWFDNAACFSYKPTYRRPSRRRDSRYGRVHRRPPRPPRPSFANSSEVHRWMPLAQTAIDAMITESPMKRNERINSAHPKVITDAGRGRMLSACMEGLLRDLSNRQSRSSPTV